MGCGVLGSADSAYIKGMDTDQFAQLAYLGLWGLALAGAALVTFRGRMGQAAQQAAVWALIFIGFIAAYGLWEDMSRNVMGRQSVATDGQIIAPLQSDGHYHLTVDVNNVPVAFIVDTGASQIVLSQSDAQRIGIAPSTLSYFGSAQTANGVVRTARVTLDSVILGDTTDQNIEAVVNSGAMDASLLGMSYLRLYDRIEISNNELVLTR